MIPNPYDKMLKLKELFYASWKVYCRFFGVISGVMFCWQLLLIGFDAVFSESVFGELSRHWFIEEFRASNLFGFVGSLFVIILVEQSLRMGQIRLKKIFQCIGNIFLSAFVIRLIFLTGGLVLRGIIEFLRSGECSELFISGLRLAITMVEAALKVYFIFVYQALLLKRRSSFFAFICSFRAVRGYWWKLFGIRLLFISPVAVPMTVLMILSGTEKGMVGAHWFESPWMLYLFHPLMAVVYAFTTVFYTFYFLNIVQPETGKCFPNLGNGRE